ncbi:hypothetical protein WJX74_008785 [Apatococcus lobatus]|uniref:Protein kinase domain-containing protein n=1 Tax=Apatococcus lobatus TaxID=904363 RepID=A0AAW1RQI2_9CHLO
MSFQQVIQQGTQKTEPVVDPPKAAASTRPNGNASQDGSANKIRVVAGSLQDVALQNVQNEARGGKRTRKFLKTTIEYMGAPIPSNEAGRLEAMHFLRMMKDAPDPRLDELTFILQQLFKVPVCLVSIVDDDHQWFKSNQGLACSSTDRKSSFCAWTLLPQHPELLIVEDALEDARFRDNPLVAGDPRIRFYAGAPLIIFDNVRIGSLCVIDFKPRNLDAAIYNLLFNFAALVVREIERADHNLRWQKALDPKSAIQRPDDLTDLDYMTDVVMILDIQNPDWKTLYANNCLEDVTGLSRAQEETRQAMETNNQELKFSAEFTLVASPTSGSKQGAMLMFHCRQALLPIQSARHHNTSAESAPNMSNDAFSINVPAMLTNNAEQVAQRYYIATVRAARSSKTVTREISSSALQDVTNIQSAKTEEQHLQTGLPARMKSLRLEQVVKQTQASYLQRALLNGQPAMIKQGRAALNAGATGKSPRNKQRRKSQLGLGKKLVETWIVREACDKGMLKDAIEKGMLLTERSRQAGLPNMITIIRTVQEIAQGLAHIHQAGLAHGDLSSTSIFLQTANPSNHADFCVKILDFEAICVEGQPSKRVEMTYVGHLAPEVLTGGNRTQAGDIYSFGILLWELLTGELVWLSDTAGIVKERVVDYDERPVFPDYTPYAYEEMAVRCMLADACQRPTIQQLLPTLQQFADIAIKAQRNPELWNAFEISLGRAG